MDRPNIVFVLSDQQRADTVGAYGQRLAVTPNLDRMAAEGVLFEGAFTCQPVCGPARACLQTGRYASETGNTRNDTLLPRDCPTIAHHLKRHGYSTAYIGKWHLASDRSLGVNHRETAVPPEHRGGWTDYWLAADALEWTSHAYDGHMFDSRGIRRDFPAGRFRADAHTDWVLEYLEQASTEQPFVLFVSYIEPHHQNDRNCYEGPVGSKERFAGYDVPGDLVDAAGDWRANYPDYLGCCAAVDDGVGRILDCLERRGLASSTLVVYTSDHGSHFRTRNSEYKRSCHDASLRVPLVLRGPGVPRGRRIDNLASLIDLPPTLLDAAGLAVPPEMRGRPLSVLWGSHRSGPGLGELPWRDEVFAQISESEVGRAIRTRRWKYAVRAPGKDGLRDPSSDLYQESFLYDLEADPHERNNLVRDGRFEPVRGQLRARLVARMLEAGEAEPAIVPADAG